MKKNKNKTILVLLLAIVMTLSVVACNDAAQPDNDSVEWQAEEASEYLSSIYDVSFEDGFSYVSFNEALLQIFGTETVHVEAENGVTLAKALVQAAEYDELALSYSDEKISERLKEYNVSTGSEDARYVAAALDADLINSEQANVLTDNGLLSDDDAAILLMNAAHAAGLGRNQLGLSSDPDISGKLMNAWNSFILFTDEILYDAGRQAVEEKVVTGFNIKMSGYNSHFISDRSLIYGHSDITHARQLIKLLNSEAVEARVQLEPKISIYEYLIEWGPVPEPTPTYSVVQFSEDLYLANAVEYDLILEFSSREEMLRFDGIIEEYAKKYEGNEEGRGLIFGSWWQPLYSTANVNMPEEYHQIFDNVIFTDMFELHSFCLPEDRDIVKGAFESFGLEVESVERFANTAFYNYLGGTDFQ